MARLRRRGASSEHRRPAAYREPAFLDTITCFAKVSTETFVAEIFCHERRGIPRSFVQVGSITTAKSWNSRMAKLVRPVAVLSRFSSDST
jgi:hypothetical protein